MDARPPLVFVHGAGRAGRTAWPEQQAAFPEAVYVTLSGFGDDEPAVPDIRSWAAQILEACGGGVHLVAHSYGALTAVEYRTAWLTASGAPSPATPATAADLRSAERLRLLPAPWDIPSQATVIAEIPTLVVTGGWNEEYEEIASALVRFGATHRELTGFGHRVQDHPEANDLIREWAERPGND